MLCVARNIEVKGNEVSIHTIVSPEEAADRLAIGELIDAYAYCADGRDAEGQMALFLPSAPFIFYMDPRSSEPTMDLSSPTLRRLDPTPGPFWTPRRSPYRSPRGGSMPLASH